MPWCWRSRATTAWPERGCALSATARLRRWRATPARKAARATAASSWSSSNTIAPRAATCHIYHMAVLNDTAEYALRAALYIAQNGTAQKPAQAEQVAAALDIPRNYLSKILHIYTRNGVLLSTRGPNGGFWL